MKSPWTNTLLLLILLLQTITGYLGLINNDEQFSLVLWLHGIGAYALVLLLFWKANIILDAIRRKKTWTWQRLMFLFTVGLLLLVLVLGLTWTLNGRHYFLNISTVSWHIYLAVPLMALMLWHSWQMRFIFRVGTAWDRRLFLRMGVLTLAGTAVWSLTNSTKRLLALAGANRRFTGSYLWGQMGEHFPSVSWIFDNPPPIDKANWQLTIGGAVANTLTFSYEQLRQLASEERTATLDCTGGWYSTQVWRGVSLGQLLQQAGVLDGAESVTVTAVSGYKRRFTLAEAASYLLALDVADAPLSHGHGFPLRLVAWDKRGVEWVKWITHIQVNTTAKIWQSPLPLQ
ncbi:MAG: molybdopterin-dependent oxidoreductase [Ardenticatenaceae bacterium]|nr:molybdopterin-dependent oxidoreductase [Ardenticatenaceae bacterium]